MRFGVYGMGTLTDAKLRVAKGQAKAYKLSDGQQLYLHVTPAGGRHWRMNYQLRGGNGGKGLQKTLTIGSYPAISLKDARAARDRAKEMLAKGLEPKPVDLFSRAEPEADTRPTFEEVGRAWHRLQAKQWSKVHAGDVLASLEADVFPGIGAIPIADIKAPAVWSLLQCIVDRGAVETAHRTRQRMSAIFVYGIAVLGLVDSDPAASLGIALPKKPRAKKQPAITALGGVRQMLIDCEAERCRASTKFALRLLALTAVRPGELHGARWSEFEGLDGAEPLWRIPAARMKGDRERKAEVEGDHLVPLSPHAVAVLRAQFRLTGEVDLVFTSDRHIHRPMSANTLRALLIRAGYYQRHVPHGFRAAFSTILNERAKAENRYGDREVIDLMLAHVPANKVEGAYNRAAYMDRRRELACEWGDMLVRDMWPPNIQFGQPMKWDQSGPGKPGARQLIC